DVGFELRDSIPDSLSSLGNQLYHSQRMIAVARKPEK
ncbi:unnamed protein product, partial [marine sediment metagenome]